MSIYRRDIISQWRTWRTWCVSRSISHYFRILICVRAQVPYDGPLWGTFRVHRIAVGKQFPSRMHMRVLWAQFRQKRLVPSSTSWRIADIAATFYSRLFSRSRDFVCSIDVPCASETERTQRIYTRFDSSLFLFLIPALTLSLYMSIQLSRYTAFRSSTSFSIFTAVLFLFTLYHMYHVCSGNRVLLVRAIGKY